MTFLDMKRELAARGWRPIAGGSQEADAVEADAQDASGTKSYPEWMQGDPDVDRLVSYADNLRTERASLRDRATQAESVWEDEQAALARFAEKFPHLIAEENETVEDDDSSFEDEPDVMTKAEFKTWQDEQEAKALAKTAEDQFEADFNKFVGDRELTEYDKRALRNHQYKDAAELEQAVNGYFEYLDSLGGTKRKRRPTTPLTGGKTATGVPNYDDMTSDEVNAAMVERARALEAQ